MSPIAPPIGRFHNENVVDDGDDDGVIIPALVGRPVGPAVPAGARLRLAFLRTFWMVGTGNGAGLLGLVAAALVAAVPCG